MPFLLSIIIPVFHEATIINTAIHDLKTVTRDIPTEIVVSDGDPGRSTLDAICNTDINAPIKKIGSFTGRGIQMNTGASVAAGDMLLFLHADTRLPLHAGKLLRSAFEDTAISYGAFDLGIDSPKPVFRIIEKAVYIRSRLTRIPYGDQGIFMRSDVFKEIGGFREIPIMEDIEMMQRLKKKGYRPSIISVPVKTSARRWEKEGILYTTFRNFCLSTLYYMGASPDKLACFYR